MPDLTADIKHIADSEYFSKCGATKKEWQTPELMEMDYNQTSGAADLVNDGGGFS